jgi:D-tyrosyl-tRNA(Tyr) deacylase
MSFTSLASAKSRTSSGQKVTLWPLANLGAMRAVIQRVSSASVTVGDDIVGEIDRGFLILLGVETGDGDKEARWLAEKIAGLRLFEDEQGKMNLALADVGGAALVVSQFTLLGDCKKGRRPSFIRAAAPEEANRLYLLFSESMRGQGLKVANGQFQTTMQVRLCNDGPVTLIVETPPKEG